MKKFVILLTLFVSLGAASAWATSACPDVSTSLTTYLATGFSCEIGDKIFSNFSYSSTSMGGALALGSGAVDVETLGSLSGTDPAEFANANIGLAFDAGWAASATCFGMTCTGAETDSKIGFVVTVIGGANMAITDAAVAETSGGASGAGSSASVSEGGCSGAPCTTSQWGVLSFITPGNYTNAASETMFSATGSVQVLKDITVTAAGVINGEATLSEVQDTFSQSPTSVPEPATMALAGAALCGIAVVRRRRAAK
jgi:hypothetical protein